MAEAPEIELPSDQTAFGEVQPLFESPHVPQPAAPTSSELPQKPSPRRWLLIGAVALVIVTMILGSAAMVLRNSPTVSPGFVASPLPRTTTSPLDPQLQTELDELDAAITRLNPVDQQFVFPPVDLQLQLESPRP